jgi:dihydroxyacetone kinase
VTAAAEEMISLLLEDVKPRAGEKVYMLVNRLRLTSYSDSFVMAGLMEKALRSRCPVAQVRVGGYQQVTDTYGYTVTLLCADDEIAPYLDAPVVGDGFLM